MKDILQSLVIAFSMYSKVPMPQIRWKERNMKYAMCFFPLIGALIGVFLFLWWKLCDVCAFGTLLRTCGLLLVPVILTGGIHLDGLMDTADALSSFQSMERKLEILKDSHAGAFAILICVCYFIAALGIYSEAAASDLGLLGVCLILSRALSALALVTFPKAKGTGLLRTFSDAAANRVVTITSICWIALCAVLLLMLDPLRGGAALALAGIVFGWYYAMSKRKFGGITGDLAGFFLQICELVCAAGVILI